MDKQYRLLKVVFTLKCKRHDVYIINSSKHTDGIYWCYASLYSFFIRLFCWMKIWIDYFALLRIVTSTDESRCWEVKCQVGNTALHVTDAISKKRICNTDHRSLDILSSSISSQSYFRRTKLVHVSCTFRDTWYAPSSWTCAVIWPASDYAGVMPNVGLILYLFIFNWFL